MSCHVCLLDFAAPSAPPSQGKDKKLIEIYEKEICFCSEAKQRSSSCLNPFRRWIWWSGSILFTLPTVSRPGSAGYQGQGGLRQHSSPRVGLP